MQTVYEDLASRCITQLEDDQQLWIGIAGGPGAGKSTLASAVADICRNKFGVEAVVLPMDGYHYSRLQLCTLDPPSAATYLPQRGAPHTFDAEAFVADMASAKLSGQASLPTYSRELSDPIPDAVRLETSHRVVFVEGNYLFLGYLATEGGSDKALTAEAARWTGLLNLFEDRWFVSPRGGVQVEAANIEAYLWRAARICRSSALA